MGAVAVAATAVIALLSLWILSTGNYAAILYLIVPALPVGLVFAVFYTSQHTDWLVLAIAIIYLLIPTSLLSEGTRGIIHYGCLLLFVLPVLPKLLRSGSLQQGNFRLYCVYFAWALVTVVYSSAPTFSLGRLAGSLLGFSAAAVAVLDVNSPADAHRLFFRFFQACSIVVALTVVSAVALPHSITWQTPLDGLDPSYIAQLRTQGISIGGIDRFRGLFGNANDVGALMLATVSSALACWHLSTKRQKYFLALVTFVSAMAALRADSRSAVAALLLGCALYVLWKYRARGVIAITAVLSVALAAFSMLHGVGDYAARGLDTLTGRTDIWAFAIQRIRDRPLSGYGYEVSGQIFASRYFPLWYGPWDMGPHSSLHNGYLTHLVGVGIPATLFWLFVVLRPWVSLFRHTSDPWNLKAVAFFALVPMLTYNLTEAALADFFGLIGFLFGLTWAVVERYRLEATTHETVEDKARVLSIPAAIRALQY